MSIEALLQAEKSPLPVERFSATMLTMFLRCPEQFRNRYVLGRKAKPSGAQVLGQADHAAHAYNFEQKIKTQVDAPLTDVLTFYDDVAWPDAVEEKGGISEIGWDHDGKPDDVRAQGRRMVETYHTIVSPLISPLAVEESFELDVDGTPVIGYIDVRAHHPAGDQYVIERKTARQKRITLKPDWRIQGRIYQMNSRCDVEWHVTTKGKSPTVWTPSFGIDTKGEKHECPGLTLPFSELEVKRTERMIVELGWEIATLYARYGPDEPWPGRGLIHDWACDWCGYQPDCFYWRTNG